MKKFDATQLINPRRDNTLFVLSRYLKILKVKITNETLQKALFMHPDYPNIWSLSEVLNDFKIENGVLRLEPQQLSELETPFIAHFNINKGSFVLVTALNEKEVTWFDSKKGIQNQKIEDFLINWSGVVLIAEPDESSGEKEFKENHQRAFLKRLRFPSIVFLVVCLITIGIINHSALINWQTGIYTLCKTLGFIVSIMLMMIQFDGLNNNFNKICQFNKKANCNSVIHSKEAKIFNFLSWSEVGMLYFGGSLLAILFSMNNPAVMQILALFTLASLPYTFWSIYFQANIIKQWCILCLTIQALLWAEFIAIYSILNFSYINTSSYSISVLVGSFSLIILLWIVLKPLVINSIQSKKLKKDLETFKGSFDVFQALLKQQPKMIATPEDLGAITIGNPNALYTITIVTNLFCNACATKHKEIEKLLSETNKINCRIIFVSNANLDDKIKRIACRILSLPTVQQAKVLNDWFEKFNQNIEKWESEIGVTQTETAAQHVERQRVWSENNNINVTPTLFFDSHKIPEIYNLNDLKNMIKYRM